MHFNYLCKSKSSVFVLRITLSHVRWFCLIYEYLVQIRQHGTHTPVVTMNYRWFYNGFLYWISRLNILNEQVLISYVISKEEFEEIPLAEYTRSGVTKLDSIERLVCVYRDDRA
ncbi:hypothetical protein HanRHA438_Chr02g0096231 [Helianthus annuus]|nr:hypothetical protein HanRHA438_Chr02g0096231 [Helianthus annuus]